MQYFQTTAFIMDSICYLGLSLLLLLSPLITWLDRHCSKLSKPKFFISSVISFVTFFFILINLTIPHLKDLPILISGDYKTIKGSVHTRSIYRNLYEEVSIVRVDTYFFLDSEAEDYKKYIVSYLPHTKRGINIETYDGIPVKVDIISIIFLAFLLLIYASGIYYFLFLR